MTLSGGLTGHGGAKSSTVLCAPEGRAFAESPLNSRLVAACLGLLGVQDNFRSMNA